MLGMSLFRSFDLLKQIRVSEYMIPACSCKFEASTANKRAVSLAPRMTMMIPLVI